MMRVLGYSWSTLLWHRCYYPHRSRDSVSPVCGIFILAESGRGRRSIAEKEDGLIGTIVPFVTSDDSRPDHETCWLLDVRSLTNPPDLVISSPKTKGSVMPQAECSWSEDSANVSQGRTGQERPG